MDSRLIAEKTVGTETLTAKLAKTRALEFTVTPLSLAASCLQFSATSSAAKKVAQVTLHATDLTNFGSLPPIANKPLLEFICHTLDSFGAKRLLAVDKSNIDDLKEQGYQLCEASDKILIPVSQLKTRLNALAEGKSVRAEHFSQHQQKLNSGEWQFISGRGSDLRIQVDLDKLHAFYKTHCSFSTGGFKDQLATYDAEAMAARFFSHDEAIQSFVLQTKDGDIIAANHLLFTPSVEGKPLAYCYDNVVHNDFRSHSEEDSKHMYQFFLLKISEALARMKQEPEAIAFILGGQGQAANGKRLSELLLGDLQNVSSCLVFKGSAPTKTMEACIKEEKEHARELLENYKKQKAFYDASERAGVVHKI